MNRRKKLPHIGLLHKNIRKKKKIGHIWTDENSPSKTTWSRRKLYDTIQNKDSSSQDYGFSSSHVWMWELDYKESWVQKKWCLWTVVLKKTLESPLDCKEIQPVHPKGNQSWIFIGRTDVEAETPTLWPPDAKNWLIGKDPDAGKDWRQQEKGMTEDEMVEWHQQLNGHDHGVRKSRTRLSDWTELKYTQRSTWKKSILNWKFKS